MSDDLFEFFFELRLEGVEPRRFRLSQEAMAAAEDYERPTGSIVFVGEPASDPLEVIVYRAGAIEVGKDVPEQDDDEDLEDPWTEEEIAANFAAGRPLTAVERAQFGIGQ